MSAGNMEGSIGTDEPLDYIEYQIFPSLSRYEASICLGNNYEVAVSGSLEPLLFHSPQIKALDSKGSDGTFKLAAPEDLYGAKWFTKSTLLRFLQIITSSEVLKATTSLRSEISQLEEANSFHVSLYEKGSQKYFTGEESDYKSEANGFPEEGTDTITSDDSKNELLRAMYLRLIALREELSNAFAKAAAITFSREEINDIEKFCSLFGATDLRKSLNNHVELSQEKWAETKKESGTIFEAKDITQVSKQSNLPVKYGCSPAKLAKIERQNSSESGESSNSSTEEELPSVERSRTLIRSASPRRSASPMRRVQIGRSGSRKSTPLTIKSLNYFPKSHNDELEEGNSNADEATEQPVNARIMSVQDAISLFENKKKDQIQKINSFSTGSVGPKKSVLRRWSTGLSGDSNAGRDSGSDNSVDLRSSSSEIKPDHDSSFMVHHVDEPTETETETETKPDRALQSESNDMTSKSLGSNQKETTSAEWSKQKEAELDELLTKMMETKPVKYKNDSNQDIKTDEVPGEKKGGRKRNEKLPSKNGGKLSYKEKQQVLDKRINANGQKSKKTTSSSSDTTKELTKPSVFRKASSKTSPTPVTRKSCPSAPPSTRTTSISPMASAGTIPSHRKSQTIPSVSKSGTTKPQLKETLSDKSKLVKNMNVKNQQPLKKTPLSTKPKVQNIDSDSTLSGKPSLYSKVTKKNSVVPLEQKPFLRKGSKFSPGVGVSPISKKKLSSQLDEISKVDLKDQILPRVNEILVPASSNPVISQQEPDIELEKSLQNLNHVALIEDDLTISPAAWVDIEEEHKDQTVNDDSICQVELSPTPRIRQSLSQMMLEETSESDLNEWGIVDNNTPTRVFRKDDGPKGLKKLLKFARKSMTTITTDGNSTGWSSPSVFSEGEDDAEESKSICKRSSSDNLLLKMATLNNGHQRTFYQDKDLATHGLFARPNMNKTTSESLSSTMQDSRNSTSFSKTKATKPFFSLSAFRSNSK